MFDLRYNILKSVVDYFVICESRYDHRNNKKKINFKNGNTYDQKKILHLILEKPFPKENNIWQNQAFQREFLLKELNHLSDEDYIFFSDPDEIPDPSILKNFSLKKKYGIFLQEFFNYKFNLFNKYETPWEGTRVCKKKNLRSIDYMRQKIRAKNLEHSFLRLDKEKNIEIFQKAGWHFNNLMSPENISLKLKTFAHSEFATDNYSSPEIIRDKIKKRIDLFERGHQYTRLNLDNKFPKYLIDNKLKYKKYIID
tara:strand:- start:236 stop:997 length:762 start_codon:yes stop_codon:yes gene_type:complete